MLIMNNTEKLKKDGILIFNQVIPENSLQKLKNGFYKHDDFLKKHGLKSKEKDLIEIRLGYEKILDFCPEILEIINYQEINKILNDYLGNNFKIINVYPTISFPVKLDMNEKNVYESDSSICIFHHDQIGKQLKLIIVLEDIEENQNCLEYATRSHKIKLFDRLIVNFLNIFGFYKNWNKNIINHIYRKLIGKPFQYLEEEKIKKKYSVKQVCAKAGSIYLFNTNGYHRQKPATELTDFSKSRNTIFLDIVPFESFSRAKLKMEFKSISKDNFEKIKVFI